MSKRLEGFGASVHAHGRTNNVCSYSEVLTLYIASRSAHELRYYSLSSVFGPWAELNSNLLIKTNIGLLTRLVQPRCIREECVDLQRFEGIYKGLRD
jgi:hypothetical protein